MDKLKEKLKHSTTIYTQEAPLNFGDYVNLKGVRKVEKFSVEYKPKELLSDNGYLNQTALEEQLYNISNFHKKVMGFEEYTKKLLENKTGRLIEEYKVNIKRLKKDLSNFTNQGAQNQFEEFLLTYGDKNLKRAEACINNINSSAYIEIVLRSMRRKEVCLEKVGFNNLKGYKSGLIEVKNFEDCSYNLVEMDCFYFLNKLKKKYPNLNISNLVKKFCLFEELEDNSYIFTISLLSYPDEFMRCCNRYRERKKIWSSEKYKSKLERAIMEDGESFI